MCPGHILSQYQKKLYLFALQTKMGDSFFSRIKYFFFIYILKILWTFFFFSEMES